MRSCRHAAAANGERGRDVHTTLLGVQTGVAKVCWTWGLECSFFFFFQAEDGIRDLIVTGVQTCALPISAGDPEEHISTFERLDHAASVVVRVGAGGEFGFDAVHVSTVAMQNTLRVEHRDRKSVV